jgi:hypothetical protein
VRAAPHGDRDVEVLLDYGGWWRVADAESEDADPETELARVSAEGARKTDT